MHVPISLCEYWECKLHTAPRCAALLWHVSPHKPLQSKASNGFGRFFLRNAFVAFLIIWCVSVTKLTAGQVIEYNGSALPTSESLLREPKFFFLFGSSSSFVIPPSAKDRKNHVKFKNLSLSIESTQLVKQMLSQGDGNPKLNGQGDELLMTSPAGVEVVLIKYKQLLRMQFEHPPGPFCCKSLPLRSAQAFTPTPECPYPGAVRRLFWGGERSQVQSDGQDILHSAVDGSPAVYGGEEIYAKPVALKGTPQAADEVTFTVRDTDMYVLVIANCGPLNDLTFDGEVEVANAFGWLPGYAYSGMLFSLACSVGYVLLCLVWGCYLVMNRKNLVPFHYCLTGVGILGLLETGLHFANLYVWTLNGRNTALLTVSIFFSVLKNISAYILVLLGALGWSITKPSLERSTVIKIQIIVFVYIIFDTLRQLSNEYVSSGSFSLVRGLVVLLPISILNVIVFYWIFSSLHQNIELLTREKQYEKLLIYRRLFVVLFGGLLGAALLVIICLYVAFWVTVAHSFVRGAKIGRNISQDADSTRRELAPTMLQDPTDRWQYQEILMDGLFRLLFLGMLAATMLIWKPHAHSRRLAYFTEIGDNDELANVPSAGTKGRDPQVWGEELDFHDHFSDDDFEDGNFPQVKLNGGIPTFTSVQVPGVFGDDKASPDENAVNGVGGGDIFTPRGNISNVELELGTIGAVGSSAMAETNQIRQLEEGSRTQVIGRASLPLDGVASERSGGTVALDGHTSGS